MKEVGGPSFYSLLVIAVVVSPLLSGVSTKVDKLHDTIAELLNSETTKKFLDNEGAAPVHMSSAEFGKFIAAEIAKWGPVVKKAGMKAE